MTALDPRLEAEVRERAETLRAVFVGQFVDAADALRDDGAHVDIAATIVTLAVTHAVADLLDQARGRTPADVLAGYVINIIQLRVAIAQAAGATIN